MISKHMSTVKLYINTIPDLSQKGISRILGKSWETD